MNCERWKGAVLGTFGGIAGLIAMDYVQKTLKPHLGSAAGGKEPGKSISLIGRQHRESESSTGALGRILYQKITGREPQTDEMKQALSYLVHWGYGIKMGSWYGFVRGERDGLDLPGGLAWGAVLWAVSDELAVPLLGLADSPDAYPVQLHAGALGAHLAYGAATAAATQLLMKIL